jgi:hypothetical protein
MSRLTSRALEQPLTLNVRLRVRLHFVICAWCRRYFEQINFLHTHAPKFELKLPELTHQSLSTEAKRRMVQRILTAKNLPSVRISG